MFHYLRRRTSRADRRGALAMRCEFLERRDMLSASAPTITNVEVASTAWSSAFISYLKDSNLGTSGYSIPLGSSAQSASLTWSNINKIVITFSKDVDINAADLSLSGVNQAAYSFSDFRYDPDADPDPAIIRPTATWTLSTPLDNDRYRLDLDADGVDPVKDLAGNILDGEWTNNVSTVSGNGTAGGDFEFNFNVLPTDVNNTGNISSSDYIDILESDGESITSSGYSAFRDVNGDGSINPTDWQEALDRSLQTLPSGTPAGTYDDAPTTNGVDLIAITDFEVEHLISLLQSFEDQESGATGLTYSILANDNTNLFSTCQFDEWVLMVNALRETAGRGNVTLRVTDSAGLYVDTVLTIDVGGYENQPPRILNLDYVNAGADTWIISGDVFDPDDDLSGFIVRFYGVIDIRSAVDENGHFEFAVILEENLFGVEYAVTFDPHGAQSNTPFGFFGMT